MPGPSSVFDDSVVYRRENRKFTSQKQSEKSSSAQTWPKRGEKGYFKSESRQPRITKSVTKSHFVSRNVQVETSRYLDPLNL